MPFDDTALSEALGARAQADDRGQRVRWLGEAAKALQRDELPPAEARVFLATARALEAKPGDGDRCTGWKSTGREAGTEIPDADLR